MPSFPDGYDPFDTPADADVLGGSRPGATGVKQRKITLANLWAFFRAKLTTTPVTIAEGGTGAASAATARTALDVLSSAQVAAADTAVATAAATDAATKANAAQAAAIAASIPLVQKGTDGGVALDDLSNEGAKDILGALSQTGPVNTIGRIVQLSTGSAVSLNSLTIGDSLSWPTSCFNDPWLRARFGDAGFVGLAGSILATAKSTLVGTAAYSVGDDHTESATGTAVTLNAVSDAVILQPLPHDSDAYPYASRPINATPTTGILINTPFIGYTKKPSAGVFKVSYATDAALTTWVDVAGLTAVDASNATVAFGSAVATISAVTIFAVRAMLVSGNPVKITVGGAWHTAPTNGGVVSMSLARGGMKTGLFAASPLTPGLLAALPTPQRIAWCGRNDGLAGIEQSMADLTSVLSPFTAADRIYRGIAQGATDSLSDIQAYNAIVAETCYENGGIFIDTLRYLGTSAEALARGFMTGVDVHPTRLGAGHIAKMERFLSGLNEIPYGLLSERINNQLAAVVGKLSIGAGGTSGAINLAAGTTAADGIFFGETSFYRFATNYIGIAGSSSSSGFVSSNNGATNAGGYRWLNSGTSGITVDMNLGGASHALTEIRNKLHIYYGAGVTWTLDPTNGAMRCAGGINPGALSGPDITSGSGAPSASKPNGSLYMRTDGTGPNLYVRENGAWVSK